jgi:hypothetical protein
LLSELEDAGKYGEPNNEEGKTKDDRCQILCTVRLILQKIDNNRASKTAVGRGIIYFRVKVWMKARKKPRIASLNQGGEGRCFSWGREQYHHFLFLLHLM